MAESSRRGGDSAESRSSPGQGDCVGRTASDNRQSKSVEMGGVAVFFSYVLVSGHASAEELSMGHIVKIENYAVALALHEESA